LPNGGLINDIIRLAVEPGEIGVEEGLGLRWGRRQISVEVSVDSSQV
jgi:hypothetical protein